VGMCGNGWKTENGVLLFIYTSVITVSLATNSSTNIPQVARYHYSLSHCCSFVAVFALISFSNMSIIIIFSPIIAFSCALLTSLYNGGFKQTIKFSTPLLLSCHC